MRSSSTARNDFNYVDAPRSSSWLFGGFWVLIFLAAISASGSWVTSHTMLFSGVGILMLIFPPKVAVPRFWWILAGLVLLFAASAFLPVSWFGMPEWRKNLEKLGLDTGDQVVIQSRQAFEFYVVFAITLLTGMWLIGHRASGAQLRIFALLFSAGVAFFAVFAYIRENTNALGTFGFFPNRNHTGTYLAMGALCGLGSILQAIRDKKFPLAGIGFVTTAICFWALFDWSISRAGILLVSMGTILWFSLLGRRYLGKNGLWIIGLIALLASGVFLLAETRVKQRITETVEKAAVIAETSEVYPEGEKEISIADLDLRIPIAIDTWELIKDFPLTGVGARQFSYVFPQYFDHTAYVNEKRFIHPESDWLWLAADSGIPAALSFLVLILCAFVTALRQVLRGRDRALRGACLVSAFLIPLHGIFDVPGHRIELAPAAFFLFTLSLSSSGAETRCRFAYLFRGMGALILLAGIGIVFLSLKDLTTLRALAPERAADQVIHWYDEDQLLAQEARRNHQPYSPPPEDDRLLDALRLLEIVTHDLPLDARSHYLTGAMGLHFDDKFEEVDKAFAIELALDPVWVGAPLRQAQAWANLDREKTKALLKETSARAEWLEQRHPSSVWVKKDTLLRMKKSVPQLKALWDE
jgi:hypothetical protein